jgi:hypothetical protein
VKISSGGGEGAAYATVREATLVVAEKPLFSLEAAVTTLNLVKGGTADFVVGIKRAGTFQAPVWSLISDYRMCGLFLTGHLDGELMKYQVRG